jgi:hypothetical protein
MTYRLHRFLTCNATSPIVYASVTALGCFFRLADETTHELSAAECREATPRWAHLESQAPPFHFGEMRSLAASSSAGA